MMNLRYDWMISSKHLNPGPVMADWSKLPYDIIHKVSTCLITVEDFLAFSAVCASWRSVYLTKQWSEGCQAPFLMFSDTENDSARSFSSLCSNRVYKSELPEASGRRCWGSSVGWLVTLGSDFEIHLLNPFTRVSIDLPSKSSLHVSFGEIMAWYDLIERAFVFNKIEANEPGLIMVMIIYGPLRQLAFCWRGDGSWRSIRDDSNGGFIDVTFVKGRIIALSNIGSLVLIDIDSQDVINIEYMHPLDCFLFPHWDWEQLFLVEASGDLWMVHQNRSSNRRSLEFVVYGYDFDGKGWARLSDLGDHAVFVGDNGCACVREPGHFNCRTNCIYFVGKETMRRWPYRELLADVVVYSMADGSCRPVFRGLESQRFYSFALWVVPTLH